MTTTLTVCNNELCNSLMSEFAKNLKKCKMSPTILKTYQDNSYPINYIEKFARTQTNQAEVALNSRNDNRMT